MFDTSLFASPLVLLLGGLTGLVFGFLLQKAHVTRAETIFGQFLLRDFTVLKVMLTAIAVGALGVWALHGAGLADLHVKGAALLANALGGVLFGIGMAILGYCPGTGVAALGDGSRDAAFGVLGMLVGAGVYAEIEPWVAQTIGAVGELGKITLADSMHVSPWWLVAAILVVGGLALGGIEAFEHRARRKPLRS